MSTSILVIQNTEGKAKAVGKIYCALLVSDLAGDNLTGALHLNLAASPARSLPQPPGQGTEGTCCLQLSQDGLSPSSAQSGIMHPHPPDLEECRKTGDYKSPGVLH